MDSRGIEDRGLEDLSNTEPYKTETKYTPLEKEGKVLTRRGFRPVFEPGTYIKTETEVSEPKGKWPTAPRIEGSETIVYDTVRSTQSPPVTEEEQGLSAPQIIEPDIPQPPEEPEPPQNPPGYEKEEADLNPTEENTRKLLDKVPDSYFKMKLGIDKDRVESCWKIADFSERINANLRKYVELRKAYEKAGDKKGISLLHEDIDQLYAYMTGHKADFHASIPLEYFKITEPLSSGTDRVTLWCVAAAILSCARELRDIELDEEVAIATARKKWTDWRLENAKVKEKEPVLQFALNLTLETGYFKAFNESWMMKKCHYSDEYKRITLNGTQRLDYFYRYKTPEALFDIAGNEATRWLAAQTSTPQTVRRTINEQPAWVKIGWKHIIINYLNKALPALPEGRSWETEIQWTKNFCNQ